MLTCIIYVSLIAMMSCKELLPLLLHEIFWKHHGTWKSPVNKPWSRTCVPSPFAWSLHKSYKFRFQTQILYKFRAFVQGLLHRVPARRTQTLHKSPEFIKSGRTCKDCAMYLLYMSSFICKLTICCLLSVVLKVYIQYVWWWWWWWWMWNRKNGYLDQSSPGCSKHAGSQPH